MTDEELEAEVKSIEDPTPEQLAWGEPAIDYALAAKWLEGELKLVFNEDHPLTSTLSVEFIKCDRLTTIQQGATDSRYYMATICRTFGFEATFRQSLIDVMNGHLEFLIETRSGNVTINASKLDALLVIGPDAALIPPLADARLFRHLLAGTANDSRRAFRVLLREFSRIPYAGVTLAELEKEMSSWAQVIETTTDEQGEQKSRIFADAWRPVGSAPLALPTTFSPGTMSSLIEVYSVFLTSLFRNPRYQFDPTRRQDSPDGLMLSIPCWQQFDADLRATGAFLGWLFITVPHRGAASADERIGALLASGKLLRPLLNNFLERIVAIEARATTTFYEQHVRDAISLFRPADSPIQYLQGSNLGQGALLFDGYTVHTSKPDHSEFIECVYDPSSGARAPLETAYLVPTHLVRTPSNPAAYYQDLRQRFARQYADMASVTTLTASAQEQEALIQSEDIRNAIVHEYWKLIPVIESVTPNDILADIQMFLRLATAPHKVSKDPDGFPDVFAQGENLEEFIANHAALAIRMECLVLAAQFKNWAEYRAVRNLKHADVAKIVSSPTSVIVVTSRPEDRANFGFALIAAIRNALEKTAELGNGRGGHCPLPPDPIVSVLIEDNDVVIRNDETERAHNARVRSKIGQPMEEKAGTFVTLRVVCKQYARTQGRPPLIVPPDGESYTWTTRLPLPEGADATS